MVGKIPTMKRISFGMAALFLLLGISSPVWGQTSSWSWQSSRVKLQEKNLTFDWSVPNLSTSPGDTAHWQTLLDKDMAERRSQFRAAYEEARKDDAEIQREHPDYTPNPWESSGDYQVVWQDDKQLVLLWQGYDYRGGAHGLPAIWATVLSADKPDSLLPPQALFSDSPEFLQALSQATRKGLAAQFAEPLDEWALKGTEPSWENFSIIYPSKLDGPARFEVIFPSYQVAPYAAGTPTVTISWETLNRWTPSLKASGK